MDTGRFEAAIRAFDEANGKDSHTERVGDKMYPRELVHARWLSEWVERLQSEVSEELRLAARCQHIERWKTPRESFPPGRRGYLDWRKSLARYHADRAGEILRQLGYSRQVIGRVQQLNLKENIKGDAETQVLEDALCLVFLEKQFHDFAQKTIESKVLRIIRRTWRKMSPRGREMALGLELHPKDRELVEKAVAEKGQTP